MDPIKADPDYQSFNTALELNEEEDKKQKLKKVCQILEDEFNNELKMRENHMEKLELQICKTRKLLHILRYVLIMSYYDKKNMQYNGEEENPLPETIDKQNRIHPAIKRLLGSNSFSEDISSTRNKRKIKHQTKYSTSECLASPKKPKTEPQSPTLQSSSTAAPTENSVNTTRKKVKHRIVVGNISKWMPSLEDSNLTHKWMVYVRGPKEAPDVSHFINKIVFYLHPSYKPHDVVEVCEPPFHLSRRGWGEFPVRVQIFFKEALNKPVDIVHNIKLDKTCSGRQTLGNETWVDIFLYEHHSNPSSQISGDETEQYDTPKTIKLEPEEIVSNILNDAEHDYCSYNDVEMKQEIFEETDEVVLEHCYCLPPDQENLPLKKENSNIENVDPTNCLIYGLDGYLEPATITRRTLVAVSELKNFLKSNKNSKIIVLGMRPQASVLKNNLENFSSNQYKLVLPKKRFKNMGEALPFLFKRLPLYSKLAQDTNYKRLYPFTSTSLEEFVKWNVGRRRSAEWSRARLIGKILVNAKIHGAANWSTKAILMYGRSHQFSPLSSGGLFVRASEEKNLLLSCYSSSCEVSNTVFHKEDVTVNVDSDADTSPEKKSLKYEDISDPNLALESSFIRQTSLDCGIILKPEILEERFSFNGAERMIYEAVKNLAENLIRRSANHKLCKKPFSKIVTIDEKDVKDAIYERPEFKTITQFKNKRRDMEFFS